VIFLQGLEDKVVPPNQAEMMVSSLEKKGIPVIYVKFPDEGHGFRKSENIIRAMEAELTFYSDVFNLNHGK
jgi:dipeptidyl aminopeptidase/acylaminoacyl peptidase